jgi:branched-chain amino acid transport system ATP-binding protein
MLDEKLLLMDEPSMGLSPTVVDEVARIIRDINQAGVTIIVVEQNARIALSLADRAYVLEVGEVTLHGDAQELANDERVKKAYLGGLSIDPLTDRRALPGETEVLGVCNPFSR